MFYSLRNIIIGYTAVIAVVLLILFITYSTLKSQEKEQLSIRDSRLALQDLQTASTNIQELKFLHSRQFYLFDSAVQNDRKQLASRLLFDSVALASHRAQIPEANTQYNELLALLYENMQHLQADIAEEEMPEQGNPKHVRNAALAS
ncbi:MAG: hypothetical protein H7Y31_17605, partial [Chitinophagaceae bacterium]|nr:hypothetical protein [Chitinophagaceae bacterium]